MAEKTSEELMAELSPNELASLMGEMEKIQDDYNKGIKPSDTVIKRISKLVGSTPEELLKGLEEGKQDEIEREKERALEPSDEEVQQQFIEREKVLLKKIKDGIRLTDEEVDELEMMYGGGDEVDFREAIESGALDDAEPMMGQMFKGTQKLSLFGMIVRFFKNLF